MLAKVLRNDVHANKPYENNEPVRIHNIFLNKGDLISIKEIIFDIGAEEKEVVIYKLNYPNFEGFTNFIPLKDVEVLICKCKILKKINGCNCGWVK